MRQPCEKGKVAAGYDPKDNVYEDVNVIRARKAKEREEKLRKQQQQTVCTCIWLHFVCRSIVPIKRCFSIIMELCLKYTRLFIVSE